MNTNTPMTAKEYLGQALALDRAINAKQEQVDALRNLLTRITPVVSDMPRASSPNPQAMESIIVRVVTIDEEINKDIDHMLSMKDEIADTISSMPNAELAALLVYRYTCFLGWARIASLMGYNERYIYKLHAKALKEIDPLIPTSKRLRTGTEAAL